MNKKPLSELELTELLAELEESSDLKQFRTEGSSDDVLSFLNIYDLRPGEDSIPNRTLFRLYRTWSKNPVNSIAFAIKIHEIFEHTPRVTKINEELFKIKREDWIYFYKNPKRTNPLEQKHKRMFEAFLKNFDLSPGDEPVNFESICLLYDRYINEKKSKTACLNKIKLESFCKIYFKQKNTTRGSYYLVSDTIWNSLSREIYNEKEEKAKKSSKHKKISLINS